jgi:RNA polymerase sigma factor for flagellar operon FliA
MSVLDSWKAYKENNDASAKDQLIIHYIDLVKIIAGKLYIQYNHNVEFEDLVSNGIIGLIDAVEKFDPSKNIKFETYANFRIRGSIIDQIRNLDWIPRSLRQKYKQLEEVHDRLSLKTTGEVTSAMVAEELGMTEDELSKLYGEVTTFSVVSLEEKLTENANFSVTNENIEFIPEASVGKKETERILIERIDQLPERERLIISLYYYSELTYKEIADVLSISESRISQLHTKAILKLREGIEDYY